MFGLGFSEILIILFIALIFIGPKKLPELAKGLGKAIREFQNAASGITSAIKENESKIKEESKAIKTEVLSASASEKPLPPEGEISTEEKN